MPRKRICEWPDCNAFAEADHHIDPSLNNSTVSLCWPHHNITHGMWGYGYFPNRRFSPMEEQQRINLLEHRIIKLEKMNRPFRENHIVYCSNCGANYNSTLKYPKVPKTCNECGNKGSVTTLKLSRTP